MHNLTRWIHALVLAGSILALACPSKMFADTYKIYDLFTDQGASFDGMDDAGNVVISSPLIPSCSYDTCYLTFFNGVSTGRSDQAPSLTTDDGTPCSPALPAGGRVLRGVCNRGQDAFTGFLSTGQYYPDVYLGSGNFLANGGAGSIEMNGLGDVIWDDQFSEAFYEAVDLNTAPAPEPNSFLLLATGLLGAAGAVYRRVTLHTEKRAAKFGGFPG